MNQFKAKISIESLLVLIIFTIFTISSFYMVLIGANVYKKTIDRTDVNNEIRSSFTYISNKVRSADSMGGIYVEELGGIGTIVMVSANASGTYYNYIYYNDGYLKESVTKNAPAVSLQDLELTSEEVIKSSYFEISQSKNVITLSGYTNEYVNLSLDLTLRADGEVTS